MHGRMKLWRVSRCSPQRRLPPSSTGTYTCRSNLWRARHVTGNTNGIRYASLEAGENDSGHISTAPNEGLFFFTNIFPLRLRWLLRLPWQGEKSLPELMQRVKRPSLAAADPLNIIEQAKVQDPQLKVTEVLPRLKEGGAFVKFFHDESVSSSADIEAAVKAYLKENPIKPWWNPFQRVRMNLVRGRPWVEDLYRLPSSRLKVEFLPPKPGAEVAELSQEQLYSFFRPYGKIVDILPQPADSKVLPRYACLDFTATKRAIMAKNCMHGYTVPESEGGGRAGTVLRITYEPKAKAHWIRDWLFNHPRIVIPILAALLATVTVAIFDPVRTFFVKAHVTRSFHLTDNRVYRWFKAQATDILTFHRKREDDSGMVAVWEDRKANIEQIQTWLMESADTFIIVQGPRGSGKRELVVDQALKHRKHKLVIGCKPIQEAHGDSACIRAAAAEVGYRPVFSWMNSISGMIDLAAQGATGVKTGFSETLDTQLAKIWNNTATALKQIALEGRKKDDKDANLSDDEYLEAHPEKLPVVVIDNFLHKSQDSSIVYDKIADWAARLTTANIAHVIFLTNDVAFSKSLSKALPGRVFRQISLSDCSPDVAKRFVVTHLDSDPDPAPAGYGGADGQAAKLTPSQRRPDLAELDECISYLGGRLTDLEFLARRIKTGETPSKAVREIIEQSAAEILRLYLFNADGSPQRRWTPEQAWLLVRGLAAADTLRYNELLLADAFKAGAGAGGGEPVLQALEQAELIAIVSAHGRPHAVRPGKPVYQAAFRLLTGDRVLRSRLDLAVLALQIKLANADVDKWETELRLIGELPRQPPELAARTRYLLGKLQAAQDKVDGWERESAALKKVLSSEY